MEVPNGQKRARERRVGEGGGVKTGGTPTRLRPGDNKSSLGKKENRVK